MPKPKMLRMAEHWLLQKAGLDRAIAFTVLGRVWSSLAGIASLVVVGHCLTAGEQGFYYTFGSLLALQVLAEMGLVNVVLQFASHEAAHLSITSTGIITGPAEARSRLAWILRFSLRWYAVAALLFAILLVPAGYYFFGSQSSPEDNIAWKFPWATTVIVSAVALLLTPISALLEGCGLIASVARYRLIQGVVANIALWIALLARAELRSIAVYATTNLIVMLIWMTWRYGRLLKSILSTDCGEAIDWWRELWPYQWRIAISWICGYFIFQIFTPLVFAFCGPIEAGRMGMSLTLSASVSGIGLCWLSTKVPQFGACVALRQFDELDATFFRSITQAIGVSSLCAVAILFLRGILQITGHPFAERILPTWSLAFLLLANIVNLIVAAEATYLRAFKREPFLFVSLSNACLTTLVASLMAYYGSTAHIAFGYLAVNTVIGLGFGTAVFHARRRQWLQEFCGDNQHPKLNTTAQPRIAA